jgi:hypothetical protein
MREQGDHHNYTPTEFFTFWRNEGSANKPNTLFVVSKPEATQVAAIVEAPLNAAAVSSTPKKVKVWSDIGVRGRTQPLLATEKNILVTFKKDTILDVIEKVRGAIAATEDRTIVSDDWFKVKYGNKEVFVWSGAVTAVAGEIKFQEEVKPEVNNADFLKGILATYELTRDILKKNGMLPEDKPVGFWAKFREAFKI